MTIIKNTLSVSPLRLTAAFMGMAAVWLFAPEIVQAAVTFGEIGQNVADNSKGVAKGITMAGYTAGAGMGVWGCVEMYNTSLAPPKTSEVYNILIYNEFYKLLCPARFIWTHGHTPKTGVCIGVS